MTPWVGGLGTWGLKQKPEQQWDRGDSAFSQFLATHRFVNAGAGRPFRGWSTDIDPFDDDWDPGADAFIDWLIARGLVGPDLKALMFFVAFLHSHAGNVGLIAASQGVQLPAVALVGTPIVKRIEDDVVPLAMPNIGVCLHLSDANRDWTATLGQLFDRRFSWRRQFKKETGIIGETAKGIGHSGLLSERARYQLWSERGWLERLRADQASFGESTLAAARGSSPLGTRLTP